MPTTGPMVTKEKTMFPEAGINILKTLAPPPREPRAKTSHYASGLEGCPRKDYYKWTDAPVTNPISPSSIGKMEAGNDAHDLFAMKLRRHADTVEVEIAVEMIDERLAYPIHGRIDILADFAGESYLIEYKSTQYLTTDRALEAPFDGALLQLWAYMKIQPADHYYLVYEDRGSKLGVEYEVVEINGSLFYRKGGMWAPSKLVWDDVIDKLAMIEQAVGEEIPPERMDTVTGERFTAYLNKEETKIQQTKVVEVDGDKQTYRSHWMCMGYCEFRDHCWLGVVPEEEEVRDA